jgi:hypothetical protein
MKAVNGSRRRFFAWLFVAAGALLFFGANWHLVHVAMVSQPDCVPHLRHNQPNQNEYRAAVSSCSLR